jgi:hypothetical protein
MQAGFFLVLVLDFAHQLVYQAQVSDQNQEPVAMAAVAEGD